jgi:DNA-binding winged helix-turn-helix (wHTH) protein
MTLFINGRRVRVQSKPLALLACLLGDLGRAIPYERLHQIMGRSDSRSSRHLLRQHMSTLREILLAHNAPCAVAVIQGIGYALCEIAEVTPPSKLPDGEPQPVENSDASGNNEPPPEVPGTGGIPSA